MTLPFILDTDTAQDDCVAILAGLHDPKADLRAVTMVAGNVSFEQQVHNAFLTFNVSGRLSDVPVYLGCPRPLLREPATAEHVHGDGVGGLTIELTDCEPQQEHAVEALVRLTDEAPGEISIVAIGPLTNIAMAALRDRAFAQNVKHLYIMCGSNNARGNITAAAEFNAYADPHAASIVLGAGFNLTMVPWAPLTLADAVLTNEHLEQVRSLGTPLADFFLAVTDTTVRFNEGVGIRGSTHPDSLTVAMMLHPALVEAESRYNVQVETASPLTQGYTAMSWGVHGLPDNAWVIEKVDADGFRNYLLSLLSTPTTPVLPIAGLDRSVA